MTKNHLCRSGPRSGRRKAYRPRGDTPITQRLTQHVRDAASRPLFDEGRLLSVAEHAGNMGHWAWEIAADDFTLSPQLAKIFGLVDAAIPLGLADAVALFHPADQAGVRRQFEGASGRRAGFEIDARIVLATGEVRSLIIKAQPEFDTAGDLAGLLGVATDVTEAFATIRSLQDRSEMLDLAASLAHLGHWVWSMAEGGLSYCSAEMGRLHGLAPEEFRARYKSPADIAAAVVSESRDHYRNIVTAALCHGRPYSIEYCIEAADGARRHIRERGQPILDAGGTLVRYIATAQDVTEQELAAAELREKTAALQALNLQKDKLFSIIAHDLLNPFNSVIGFADLLAGKARELSPGKVAAYAEMVREAAGSVHTLLDNLLAWASYQIQGGALELVPLDLGAVAAGSIEPLRHMAEAKNVSLVNGVAGLQALGDEALVRIVIRNLVSNSIKFCRAGGLVQISAANAGETPPFFVRVTVRDNGVGIPAAAASHLFDICRASSSSGTRGEKGTGLGLFLCRDIVSRHGGAMTVESEAGAGAAFHFTLPALL